MKRYNKSHKFNGKYNYRDIVPSNYNKVGNHYLKNGSEFKGVENHIKLLQELAAYGETDKKQACQAAFEWTYADRIIRSRFYDKRTGFHTAISLSGRRIIHTKSFKSFGEHLESVKNFLTKKKEEFTQEFFKNVNKITDRMNEDLFSPQNIKKVSGGYTSFALAKICQDNGLNFIPEGE